MKRSIILFLFVWSSFQAVAQQLEWAISLGGNGYDQTEFITLDDAGNVYLTGYFSGTVDFDPGPGTSNLTAIGTADAFIQKLDAEGNYLWAKSMGGADDAYPDRGYSIAIDLTGNVYTTGIFYDTGDFDPGAGVSNLTSAGKGDVFIQKLDAMGNFIWAKSMGGAEWDYGFSIVADQLGNVYTTGQYMGTVDLDPNAGVFNLNGYEGTFIQKLSPEGNLIWAKGMESAFAMGIAIDVSNHVYLTGSFYGTVDFDPGAGSSSLTPVGCYDMFVQKLDTAGNFVWVKSVGGYDDEEGTSIAVDGEGYVYTTGYFRATADFDPGPGVLSLTPQGITDIFIQKLDSEGKLVWAKGVGGNEWDRGLGIAVDGAGNVYTTGRFSETVDFDPNAGLSFLSSQGAQDVFTLKLDSDGNYQWAIGMGGSLTDGGHSIAVDGAHHVFTTGSFVGEVDADPNEGTTLLTSAGQGDIFLQKLSQLDVGIDPSPAVHVRLYPNPSSGQFYLELPPEAQTAELTITDAMGRMVYQRQIRNSQTALNLTQLPNGAYPLRLTLNTGQTYHGTILLRK